MLAEFKYIINDIPPSNNKYIGRSAQWEYQEIKKQWAQLIYYTVGKNKPKEPFELSVVEIFYYFSNKRRRDPDNYSGKFILDGLVKAGVIKDDSFECITLVLKANYDKHKPRTEIVVRETEQALRGRE